MRMFSKRGLIGLALMLLSSIPVSAEDSAPSSPVPVIFDTDMCLDNDDGMALAIVYALHERREANLLAVTLSVDEKWCVSYTDILNTFYGHPDIPIGAARNGLSLAAAQENSRKARGRPPVKQGNPSYIFAQLILKQKNPDGSPLYPHRLTDGSQAPKAISLLRKTLATQPDGSVVMIQVGNSGNFAALLDSRPDAFSNLSGPDLVKRKVRFLSVMAGTFQDVIIPGEATVPKGTGINNFDDIQSAQKVFKEWPTRIVASGAEIAVSIRFPGLSIERDFSYVPHHPIAESYRYICTMYLREKKLYVRDDKCPHDHHTADLAPTLYALRPDRNYFSLSKPGKITVLPNGNTHFDDGPNGQHFYLTVNEEQKVRAQEALMMLVSQPPVNLKH